MYDVLSQEVTKETQTFLLSKDSNLIGDPGPSLKEISSLKYEPVEFWEGIIKELIL